VKVEDAKTHEDVTAYILTQVVLEEAKSKSILLPVPFFISLYSTGTPF